MAQSAQVQEGRRVEMVPGQGPGKYELLILGLGEGKSVEFTLNQRSGAQGRFVAFLYSVAREDGSNNSWIVVGSIKENGALKRFSAYYNTKTRRGVMFIKDW